MVIPDDVRDRVTSYIKHQATKSPQAIADLVSTTQVRFLEIVAPLDHAIVARQPAPDEWSIHDLVRHVISAESGVAKLVHGLARGVRPDLKGAGIGSMVEAGSYSGLLDQLRATNEALLDAIAKLPAAPDTQTLAPHPFFGDLNCLEWATFQRVHDADHVQHAEKILAALRA
jgi:hypothetical protein